MSHKIIRNHTEPPELTCSAHRTEPPAPLTTFAYTPSRSSEIIATGPGSDLFMVNVNRGSIVRRVRSLPRSLSRWSCVLTSFSFPPSSPQQQTPPVPLLHLRRSTQLVASTVTGSLVLLDARTSELTVGESVLAHTGGISQVEAEGNYIVTIGYTMRSVSGSYSRPSPANQSFPEQARPSPPRPISQAARHSLPAPTLAHPLPHPTSTRSLPPSSIRERYRRQRRGAGPASRLEGGRQRQCLPG